MKITLLDTASLGEGLDFNALSRFGEIECYESTDASEIADRISETEVLIVNKIKLNAMNLPSAKKLKLICVFATGYDNIDTDYCRNHSIAVCNVRGYSTQSVAQVTAMLTLNLMCRAREYTEYVGSGKYTEVGAPNYLEPTFHELYGKTWGIIGYGAIGKKVAKIAEAFGCRVIVNKRTADDTAECVTLDTLLKESDVVTIHVPLTEDTRRMINEEKLKLMKKNSILVNAARGAVTDEAAVARCIENGSIAGFGCDVYSIEPFGIDHPFNRIKNLPNVCLTPHMAWAAMEARVRCLDEIIMNIDTFIKGEMRNRIV